MAINNRLAPRPNTSPSGGGLPRKRMRLLSIVCLLVGAACIVMFFAGNTGSTIAQFGVGEGLFLLVMGFMFHQLSNTPKTDKTITVFGKTIKKTAFVLFCLAAAYFLFYGAVSIFAA